MGGRVYFAIPGDIEAPTGGYGYDRRLIAGLNALGWTVDTIALPGGFPFPDADVLTTTEAILNDVPAGALLMIDGLAFGAMPDLAGHFSRSLRLVALVHHPLADETALSALDAEHLAKSERRALGFARQVICTSQTTARRLADGFGVEADRLTVALPGTDRHPRPAPRNGEPIIVSLGALIPRKGHDVLLKALARLSGRNWSCRIVGSADRDPDWTASLTERTKALGLSDRVCFVGTTSDPASELRAASIFALPSRHEGYGMVFAEALSHGLPIIACKAGAVPEVVPPEAGILVPPDDPEALANALGDLLDNNETRSAMANAAWQAGQRLPGWNDTAIAVATALEKAAS